MDSQDAAWIREMLDRELWEYAANRQRTVVEGRETPELAALLVQKFGYGMERVLRLLQRSELLPFDSADFRSKVDTAVASINPEWAECQSQRWQAQRAGICLKDK